MKRRAIIKNALALVPLFGQGKKAVAQSGLHLLPAEFPFDLSRAASEVDAEISVTEYRVYHFALVFDFAGSEQLRQLLLLVGKNIETAWPEGSESLPGYAIGVGVIVPIHLRISAVEADQRLPPLFDQTIKTRGHYVHGFYGKNKGDYYGRMIAQVPLKPGRYQFHLATTKDSPELSAFKTHARITFQPKATPISE